MGFDTVITNGTVVTATDTYQADVAIEDGRVVAARRQPAARKCQTPDRRHGQVRLPRRHRRPHPSRYALRRHHQRRRFRNRHPRRGLRRHHHHHRLRHPVQRPVAAQRLRHLDAESPKAVADYGFHCIITDLPDAQLEDMPQLVREGVTSFKLFMAYPGVFMVDDATIFKAMRTSAKRRRA